MPDQIAWDNIIKSTLTRKSRIKHPKKENNKTIHVHCFDTPVGKVFSAADEVHVYILLFEGSLVEKRFHQICDELDVELVLETKNKILNQLDTELKAYFDGKLQKFTVPIKTFGTQFQQTVWEKLQDLPYGTTHTYGDLAKSMGYPASHARAIGNACGKNALLVLIPCHRVVAADSKGGFNSGAERKEWLINHEKVHAG